MENSERIGAPKASGWLYGFLIGLAASLAILPSVRTLVVSQAEYAATQHSADAAAVIPHSMSGYDRAQITRAALSFSDDYLIQVGRATVDPGELPSSRRGKPAKVTTVTDNALVRIGQLPVHFPSSPGAYAHLSRYMMADRIHLLRPDLFRQDSDATDETALASEGSIFPRPAPADISLTEWALRTGERRDKDNAYWPAMLAVTAFSVGRDEDGQEALTRAATKSRWDSYIYEEVLGQWRLLSTAYGDNGALQKIGPLSLVSFPHLREIRRMGRAVRAIADRQEQAGLYHQAAMSRLQLMRTGEIMVKRAPWAYEALAGGDLILISASNQVDSSNAQRPSGASTAAQFAVSSEFIDLIRRARLTSNLPWVEDKVKEAIKLRQRVDIARLDTSYPGIPPGIPVANLFGTWMAGVAILQETFLTAVCIIIAILLELCNTAFPKSRRLLAGVAVASTCVSIGLTFSSSPSAVHWIWTILCVCLTIMQVIYWRTFPGSEQSATPYRGLVLTARGPWLFALPVALLAGLSTVVFRPLLSAMHPVAAALYSLTDTSLIVNQRAALELAATATIAPALVLLLQGISVYLRRRNSDRAIGSPFALRAAVPSLICLILLYVALLNRTVLLDKQYGRALSDAARNDLQWVLTHSSSSG